MIRLCVFTLAVFFVVYCTATAEPKDEILTRKLSAIITSTDSGYSNGNIAYIGKVRAGAKYQFEITLSNQIGSSLELVAVESSCDCVDAQVPRGEFPGGAEVKAIVRVNVQRAENKDYTQQFTIVASDNRRVTVRLAGELEGMATIKPRTVYETIGESEESIKYRIPLLISEDVDIKKLKLEASGELGTGEYSIERQGKQAFAVCETFVGSLDGLTGELCLSFDEPDSTKSCTLVVISRDSRVKLVPVHVQMNQATPKEWNGYVIVNFRGLAKSSTQTEGKAVDLKDLAPKVTVSAVGEKNLKVEHEIQRLAQGIYRVNLKCDFQPWFFDRQQGNKVDSNASDKKDLKLNFEVQLLGDFFHFSRSIQF